MGRRVGARRKAGLLVAGVVIGAALSASGATAGATPAPGVATPGRYIVVFEPTAGSASVESASGDVVASGGRVTHSYRFALRGFAAELSAKAVAELRADPDVASIEADTTMSTRTTQPNPPSWGLDRIDQRNLPLHDAYGYTTTGRAVTAYVVDTGIRTTHTDFGGRAVEGYTAVDDGRGAQDCNGHGTHVAGTVGGTSHGVAKQVRLVAVRVFDCTGSGSTSAVIAGIDWIVGHHRPGRPAVANLSIGGSASPTLDAAVHRAVADGVTVVAAAGGSAGDACTFSPARVPPALTAGSSTPADVRAPSSNVGPCIDLFAPGTSITSAWHTSDTATATLSGTSMAAAHVTGVAARYLQADPAAPPASVHGGLVRSATTGVLGDVGTGSPNRLLFMATGR
jgi:subtilisin family serine protease